jgi:CspA family cold shock protein
MADAPRSAVCQSCGRGFVFTTSYQNYLERRGAKVSTPMLCVTCFRRTGPLPKREGRVKWFDPRKHYGFIVTDEGLEVFFHREQILDNQDSEPLKGQTILFHLHYAPKGPEALNVELV